jgi:hypothetical protein
MTEFILEVDIQGCVDCKLKHWDSLPRDPYRHGLDYAYHCIVTGEMLFYENPASYDVYRHERCPLKKIEGLR